jgi:RNA polymerase II subunit A small phosphatase-like protein
MRYFFSVYDLRMWTRFKRAVPNLRGNAFTFDLPAQDTPPIMPDEISMEDTAHNPSMCRDPSMPYVLPPRKAGDNRKYTVVLDLDETLVYGREGPLYKRPFLNELLEFLIENFETIVWTAGERAYAKRIIRSIDPRGAIEHCIYRHPKWFNGASHWKDLSLIGRDIDNVLLIDNTPDCIRGQAVRAVLVSDFWGGNGEEDYTLLVIRKLLADLKGSGLSVREYLPKSAMVSSRFITSKSGNEMYLYCLDLEKYESVLEEEQGKTAPPSDSFCLVSPQAGDDAPINNVSFISPISTP